MMRTRFAPSPTGRLHLGHAYSAVIGHDLAQAHRTQEQRGMAEWLVRIDDLDAGRVRADFVAAIMDDLAWLGLVPDAPPVFQSARTALYAAAFAQLRDAGLAYPCFCTRAQIAARIEAAAAAPHGLEPPYPGTCRALGIATRDARIAAGEAHAWRLDMGAACAGAGALHWPDQHGTAHPADPARHGDIVLVRKDGAFAYHLASTVDDAQMGITHVVRGEDLLASTDVHRLLQALLGLATPAYLHHRLITGPDGKRLAKRDGAAELAALRRGGTDPAALVERLRTGALEPGFETGA